MGSKVAHVDGNVIYPDWPTLTGRQEPHHHSAFDGDDVHGAKAEILGRRIGVTLMPWQSQTLREWMLTRPDGRWTHPSCCLIVPRQNGKSEILLLRCLYGVFARREKIIYTTQRWDTAKELGERMIDTIKSRPSLRKRLDGKPTMSQGRVVIKIKAEFGGGKIAFQTRSVDGAKGFTKVDLIVYDEAYNLSSGERTALQWTQMAADGTQSIYTSTAVDDELHPKGLVLAGIRRRGLDGGRGLSFREHMAPEELDWDSFEAARYANPSYGVIQNDDKITKALDEVVSEVDKRGYEVDGLGRGRWPVDPSKREREIPNWSDLAKDREDLTLEGSIALALDRSYDGRVWSLAAAQRGVGGRIHVELGWMGTTSTNAQMVALVRRVIEAWDPVALVIDKRSPAAVLVPHLLAAGIEPVVTNTPQMAVACQGFLDDALDGELTHCADPDLDAAAEGAAKRIMPQGDFAWDRKMGALIAPLVAATLARWGLVEFEIDTPTGALPEIPTADNLTTAVTDDEFWTLDDFDAMSAAM